MPVSVEKEPVVEDVEMEHAQNPQDSKLIQVTIFKQPIRHAKSNIEFIGSSIPQPTVITQPESPQVTQRTAKGKRIATDDSEEPTKKLAPASRRVRQDPDDPIRIPYEIHGNIYNLTNDEIQEYLNKEEEIKKKANEAKLLAMTNAKGGEQFKKIQVAEIQVYKREHSQKVKKQMELRKRRLEQYLWTTSSRLKPEPITDVKIHLNSKPIVLIIYIGNDRRNFDVHNPFKFADFRVIELDELGPIIENKKNKIVSELMISLEKRYERLRKIPEELGIQSALPAHKQAKNIFQLRTKHAHYCNVFDI
ncbi:hypothetical protein Tco_0778051, partial [Tanacetum coccineum]